MSKGGSETPQQAPRNPASRPLRAGGMTTSPELNSRVRGLRSQSAQRFKDRAALPLKTWHNALNQPPLLLRRQGARGLFGGPVSLNTRRTSPLLRRVIQLEPTNPPCGFRPQGVEVPSGGPLHLWDRFRVFQRTPVLPPPAYTGNFRAPVARVRLRSRSAVRRSPSGCARRRRSAGRALPAPASPSRPAPPRLSGGRPRPRSYRGEVQPAPPRYRDDATGPMRNASVPDAYIFRTVGKVAIFRSSVRISTPTRMYSSTIKRSITPGPPEARSASMTSCPFSGATSPLRKISSKPARASALETP